MADEGAGKDPLHIVFSLIWTFNSILSILPVTVATASTALYCLAFFSPFPPSSPFGFDCTVRVACCSPCTVT